MASRSASWRAGLDQPLAEAEDGVAVAPEVEEFVGHVLGAAGFLVAAHAERLHFQQRRASPFSRAARDGLHDRANGKHVVAVHDVAGHPVARSGLRHIVHGERVARGRGEAVAIVFHDEQDGQLPRARQAQRLVKLALAGRALAHEGRSDGARGVHLRRQAQAVGHGQHRREVRDHAHDALLGQAEVKRAVAAVGEAALAAHELAEQARKLDAARGPHAQVAVHRQQPIAVLQAAGDADGDGLLPVAAEPLGDAVLADEPQHLLLDGPRELERAVERQRIGGGLGGRQGGVELHAGAPEARERSRKVRARASGVNPAREVRGMWTPEAGARARGLWRREVLRVHSGLGDVEGPLDSHEAVLGRSVRVLSRYTAEAKCGPQECCPSLSVYDRRS